MVEKLRDEFDSDQQKSNEIDSIIDDNENKNKNGRNFFKFFKFNII